MTSRPLVDLATIKVTVLAGTVAEPEGPVSLGEGSWLVTDMAMGRILRIDPDGQVVILAETPRPNGLAVDAEGEIWIAESIDRALIHLGRDGTLSTVSTGARGLSFLWPNDLCFGPDGAIYLTDSGVEVGPFEADHTGVDVDGRVFRIDPGTGHTEVFDRGLEFANGIAFGPDGQLYVAETLGGTIVRYSGGTRVVRSTFATVVEHGERRSGRITGPDGIAFDAAGDLLVAVLGRGDVTVIGPTGQVIGKIGLPGTFPTNLAFGPRGSHTVLVTEGSRSQVLLLDWPVDGLPLHLPAMR